MTLLDDRLKEAGVNTAQARLHAHAVSALQKTGGSIPSAVEILWVKLMNDPWVVQELWLRPYLLDCQRDMRGAANAVPEEVSEVMRQPRVRPQRHQPSPERKKAIAKIIEKAVAVVRFNYKTSDGRDWANVGAHELNGMDRDGSLARAIKAKLGALSNAQRFMTLGELMTQQVFSQVKAASDREAAA